MMHACKLVRRCSSCKAVLVYGGSILYRENWFHLQIGSVTGSWRSPSRSSESNPMNWQGVCSAYLPKKWGVEVVMFVGVNTPWLRSSQKLWQSPKPFFFAQSGSPQKPEHETAFTFLILTKTGPVIGFHSMHISSVPKRCHRMSK
jgi:hypothetical protein